MLIAVIATIATSNNIPRTGAWPSPQLMACSQATPMDSASLLHLSMVFCYSDFSARTLQTGFPRHALLLPVPTWLLFAVPFLTGVVFLFVYIVGWINLNGVF